MQEEGKDDKGNSKKKVGNSGGGATFFLPPLAGRGWKRNGRQFLFPHKKREK